MNALQVFVFCPRCGVRFSGKNDGYLACGACELKYFDSPKPCAGVIPISREGKILLVERALDPHKGKLDILGGFLQAGETFEEGVQREAREELGLTLNGLIYIASYSHQYVYQDIEYTLATAIFTAPISADMDLEVADDVASYRFFSPKAVTEDMLAFPELKSILGLL
jgi:NAD+ diphosphatase